MVKCNRTLEHKEDINGKPSEFHIKSVQLTVICQRWFLRCDKCTIVTYDVSDRRNWVRGYLGTL